MKIKKLLILFFFFILIGPYSDCLSQNELNPQQLAEIILKKLDAINTLETDFVQTYGGNEVSLRMQGRLFFCSPDSFRSSYSLSGSEKSLSVPENLIVYDGNVFWMQETSAAGRIKVMRSCFKSDSLQADKWFLQYSPRERFKKYLTDYNLISADLEVSENKKLYVLSMELKNDSRERMVNLLKAKASDSPESQVMERIIFFWDEESAFIQKIEAYSKDNAYKTVIEYTNAQINSGLDDDLFVYAVPRGAEVLDMTDILKKEQAKQEYQGAENKMAGKEFPDFKLNGVFDDQYSMADLKGKVLIINFWEYGFSPSVRELPEFEKIYQDIYTDDHVRVISVTSDKEKALEIVEQCGYSLPVLIDSEGALAEALQVKTIPRTFIVGKDGMVKYVYIGCRENIGQIIKEHMKELNPEE